MQSRAGTLDSECWENHPETRPLTRQNWGLVSLDVERVASMHIMVRGNQSRSCLEVDSLSHDASEDAEEVKRAQGRAYSQHFPKRAKRRTRRTTSPAELANIWTRAVIVERTDSDSHRHRATRFMGVTKVCAMCCLPR